MSAKLDQSEVLRSLTDKELALVVEDAIRAGDQKVRTLINDELRRRKMPTIPIREW